MKAYHMSQTLKTGDCLIPDHQHCAGLALPFVQALEHSEDCFYGMVLNGKYLYAVLDKSGLREWANYVKWSVEGAFEFIRKSEFPDCCSRLCCNYFYDNLSDCRRLYEYDWGSASAEEQSQVRLFEIELDGTKSQRRDMSLFDEAYSAMEERQDVQTVLACARRYFAGEQTESPVWEILSDENARAVADLSSILKDTL